jgi:hypothetical protein
MIDWLRPQGKYEVFSNMVRVWTRGRISNGGIGLKRHSWIGQVVQHPQALPTAPGDDAVGKLAAIANVQRFLRPRVAPICLRPALLNSGAS